MKNLGSLQNAAIEYERNVKSYLQQMLRVGSANMAGQPAPWGPSGSSYVDRRGATFRSGESPTDTQVKQWINAHGGNPYRLELMSMGGGKKLTRRQVANALTRAGAAEQNTLASFLQDAQDRLNEANDANKQRYEDILKRLEDRYSRNMGRVENWGKTAEADARESAFETMAGIQANLSARGLGNSTIVEAFRQRNARDLNRNLTQISEMRDSRAAQYDQALSGDIASFMERRTDKAPDFGQIAALAQAYGVGGGGQGFAGQDMGDGTYRQTQYMPAQQAPQIMPQGGVSAQTAMMMAGMTGAMMSPMMAAAYGPRIGYVPNQFVPREREYATAPTTAQGGNQSRAVPQANQRVANNAGLAAAAAASGAFGGLGGLAAGIAGMAGGNSFGPSVFTGNRGQRGFHRGSDGVVPNIDFTPTAPSVPYSAPPLGPTGVGAPAYNPPIPRATPPTFSSSLPSLPSLGGNALAPWTGPARNQLSAAAGQIGGFASGLASGVRGAYGDAMAADQWHALEAERTREELLRRANSALGGRPYQPYTTPDDMWYSYR